jgi:hypothetical protein
LRALAIAATGSFLSYNFYGKQAIGSAPGGGSTDDEEYVMSEPDEGPGAAPVKKSKIKEAAPVEEKIDSVIHVDRAVAPAHPEWMKTPVQPELEATGPAEYDLKTSMDITFLPGQGDGKFTGLDAYEHLKSNNLLEGCLGLGDGLAIQERGVKAFSKFFEAKESAVVALWKAVFTDEDGKLSVPLAIPVLSKIAIVKGDLSIPWTKNRPLVRFKS